MKLMWTGTDTLFFSSWPPYKWYYVLAVKIFARIADLFVQEHYVVSAHLRPELKGLRKPIKVLEDPPLYTEPVEKLPHYGINILYLTKKGRFWEWIYGTDIVRRLEKALPQCTFIGVDGSNNMESVYAITDFYIRPNRHDGHPRMIEECKINNIPYLATRSDPSFVEFYTGIKRWLRENTK